MPSDKPSWKKLIGWLGPVLLASLGLHALLLLVPIPESEPIEEVEVELPDPIQVTELPLIEGPELPPEAPPAAFIPEPAPVIEEAPPPEPEVQQPIVIEAAPLPPDEPDPLDDLPDPEEDLPEDSPDDLENDAPDDSEDDTPDSQNSQSSGTGKTPQPSNFTGTTKREEDISSFQFAADYGVPTGASSILDLGYLANGECFDQGDFLDATFGISINPLGNIEYSELLRKTQYPVVNSWLQAFVDQNDPKDLPSDVFTDLQQLDLTAPADGTILDWLNYARNNPNEPLTSDQDSKSYAIQISISIEDIQCDPPGS